MPRVLGFDVRYAPSVFLDLRWDATSREMHLLDPAIRAPLSVDRRVWPSRFRMAGSPPPVISRADDILVQPDEETAYFEAFDLWPTLGSMLPRHLPTTSGDCAVMVCLADEDAYEGRLKSDDWWAAAYPDAPVLGAVDKDWVSLGHDVANGGMISALSNCGLGLVRQSEGLPAWAASLGPRGLLGDLRDAVEGCRWMNARFGDDGPFYVFELHVLWGAPHLGGTP